MSDLRSPGLTPSTWRERVGALCLGVVLVVIMTWPTVPGLTSVGRLGTSDGRFSIWNVAWVAHAFTTQPSAVFDANIFHPSRGTLAYSEMNLVGGALGVPTYLATGAPLAAMNGAVAVALLLAFLWMWRLVRRLSGSSAAGLVAATMFTFAPYVSARTAHVQLLMVFVFPMVVDAFVRVLDRPSLSRGLWLGTALGIAALANGYFGLYLVAILGVLALWWVRTDLRVWTALGSGAVATIVVVVPIWMVFGAWREASGAADRIFNPEEWRTYSATWRAYLTSGAEAHAWMLRALGPMPADGRTIEVLFPGYLTLALGVAGAVAAWRVDAHSRRWAVAVSAMTVVGVWLSFGPDGGLYTVLAKFVPGMALMRAPARIGIVLPFGLAILAGWAVAQWTRPRAWLAAVLVVACAAEVKGQWPLDTLPEVPPAYRLLATLPRGGVVEFPFPYRSSDFHNHSRAMLWSTFHWQPLVNGYSDLSPAGFEDIAGPINAFPDAASFEIMRRYQVRYVLWRKAEYNADARAILDARFAPYVHHLREITREGDVWLYEIVDWPAPTGGQP
jgi:hypothetical protein